MKTQLLRYESFMVDSKSKHVAYLPNNSGKEVFLIDKPLLWPFFMKKKLEIKKMVSSLFFNQNKRFHLHKLIFHALKLRGELASESSKCRVGFEA